MSPVDLTRGLILGLGWPVLVVGSAVLLAQAYRFFLRVGKAPFGRVVLVMVAGWLATMYCLGVTASAFMWFDPANGVPVVLPVFAAWAVLMTAVSWSVRRWGTEAARIAQRLEAASREKTQLINHASHEINTPLTPLRLQVHVLRAHLAAGRTSEARRSVDMVDRNLGRLGRLAHDLLDSANLQTGQLVLRRTPFDLAELAASDSFFRSRPSATPAAAIESHLQKGLWVDCDPDRIREVLRRLVTTIDAASDTPNRIVIDAVARHDEVDVLVRGMPGGQAEDAALRAFQPFGSFSGDRTGEARPTGLDLYLCKGIVEAHGGHIWFRDAGPKQGALFGFSIPKAAAPVRAT